MKSFVPRSFFSALLAAALALGSASSALADTETVDGVIYTYSVKDGGAVLGNGTHAAITNTTAGALTIPSTLGGYPVTAIGDYAFKACSRLTSVTIPAGVTDIGSGAFGYCSGLAKIAIPDGVTNIAECAFYSCLGLTDVTIGAGVVSIGVDAFIYCSALARITVASGNTSFRVVDGVLYDKAQTRLLLCPPESGKTTFSVPETVKKIDDDAFCNCSTLTAVTIAAGVEAFGENAFYRCRALTVVTIGAGVKSIGNWAFGHCSALKVVTIGADVKSIGYAAFSGCSALREVDYLGDAPTVGDEIYAETPDGLTNYVASGTTGWSGTPGSTYLPDAWPKNDHAMRPIVRVPAGSVRIHFDANGGTASFAVRTYSTSATFGILPTATRDGYEFLGWYTAGAAATRMMESTLVSSSLTVFHAHWRMRLGTALAGDSFTASQLTFTTGGAADWYGVDDYAGAVGQKMARSGMIGDSQTSWIETTVAGPGKISFVWDVSSEATYDKLAVCIDGATNNVISGTNIAHLANLVLPITSRGAHTLRWAYVKDGNASRGLDCGWVGKVRWVPATVTVTFDGNGGTASLTSKTYSTAARSTYGTFPTATRDGYRFLGWYMTATGDYHVTAGTDVSSALTTVLYAHWSRILPQALGEALAGDSFTASHLTFTTGGDAVWFTVDDYAGAVGQKMARSGVIGDSQTSWIETTVAGPGKISFAWDVSSEATYDKLAFCIDGVTNNVISGTNIAHLANLVLSITGSGSHVLRWVYVKDGTTSRGLDCGWVANVRWNPTTVTVAFNGNGGTATAPSASYTINALYGTFPTAVRKGYTFAGWYTAASGGSLITVDTIVGREVTAFYAHWKAIEILAATDPLATSGGLIEKGAFAGFFYGQETVGTATVTAVKGLLTVTVAKSKTGGTIAAKATFANAKLSFKSKTWGTADADGTYAVTMTAASGEALTLSFRENRVQGALAPGSKVAETCLCEGARNRFKAEPASAFAGSYTVGLPATFTALTGTVDVTPHGYGFLSVKIGANGKAKAVGALPDGAKVSCSVTLLDFDTAGGEMAIPVFAPLYSKKGMFGALLWIRADGAVSVESEAGWNGFWSRPGRGADGFTAALGLEGGRLNAGAVPSGMAFATTGAPELWAGGIAVEAEAGALPDGLAVGFGGGKFTVAKATKPAKGGDGYAFNGPTDAGLKLTASTSTGVVKGSYKLYYDTGKALKTAAVKVQGVLLPGGVRGFGLVPETDPSLSPYSKKRSVGIALE